MVVGGQDVAELLVGHELAVIDVVKKAYQAHGQGQSSLPHSTFLHFPDKPGNRIIALPAYLGGDINSVGLKWIASFPGNVTEGSDRASAILILNSAEDGRPRAVLESSIISAWRTAASATLAARVLASGQMSVAGLIGCGLINFEVFRFLQAANLGVHRALVYDLNKNAAETFKMRCSEEFPGLKVEVADDCEALLEKSNVISFATTAAKPHVRSLAMCSPGAVVLHLSLRDLAPEVILASDNVVDDIDHVCRAQTSIHLTEQQTNHRRFVRCTLADILNNNALPHDDSQRITVFSPFGLGILDVAVGEFVLRLAEKEGRGAVIRSFLPRPWRRMSAAPAS